MSKVNKTDIVLFHPSGEEYIKVMIFNDMEYTLFDPANDIVYSLNRMLKSLYDCVKLNYTLLFKGLVSIRQARNFFRKYKAIIIANQLRGLSPKLVLTFIDNSSIFHLVCEAYDEVPFLAIQNGGRHSWCVENTLPYPDLKYHIDEYFCFGPYVKNLFEKNHHSIKKYITCGSLLGGYYFSTSGAPLAEKEKIYDICLISQWQSHFSDLSKMPKEWVRLGEAIDILTSNVAQFVTEHSLVVCVALRSSRQEEHDYYMKYFKGNCIFQHGERLTFSSYKAVSNSRLSVAINSTLSTESFGSGQKVLFVNPFDEKWLIPTSSIGSWYLNKADYKSFSTSASRLLDMSNDEYLDEAKSEMKNVISLDLNRPPHQVIRNRLLEILNY